MNPAKWLVRKIIKNKQNLILEGWKKFYLSFFRSSYSRICSARKELRSKGSEELRSREKIRKGKLTLIEEMGKCEIRDLDLEELGRREEFCVRSLG